MVEANDAIAVTDALGLDHYHVIGTSRGGILAVVMATMRAAQISRIVLNDIGPRIEVRGLARIKAYLGRIDRPANWDEAVRLLKDASAGAFPERSAREWRAVAEATFHEQASSLRPSFDRALLKPLGEMDLSRPLPEFWSQFAALRRHPVLAVRGALSDLLSAETLREMEERHPRLRTCVVPATGHAPSLSEPAAERAVLAFLSRAPND